MKPARNPALALLLLASLAAGQSRASGPMLPESVVHVDADAPPGGDGRSWGTAFDDLRDALRVAREVASVRSVWIAGGTYRPGASGGSREASFRVPHRVDLHGGFAGFETALEQRVPGAEVTILSGDLQGDDGPGFANRGDNVHHVVTLSRAKARLDELVIRGGNADGTGPLENLGGGILATTADLELVDVVLEDNSVGIAGQRGGGGAGVWVQDATLLVRGCRFAGNRSQGPSSTGAGAYVFSSPGGVTFESSSFEDNDGEFGVGLGLERNGPCVLRSCRFVRNRGKDGVGLLALANASLQVRGGVFNDNDGRTGIGAYLLFQDEVLLQDVVGRRNTGTSGVFHVQDSSGRLERGTLVTNQVEGVDVLRGRFAVEDSLFQNHVDASGVRLVDSDGEVRGSSFIGNRDTSGAGILLLEGTLVVEGCLFRDNQGTTGSAVYGTGESYRMEVSRCVFRNNFIQQAAGLGHGGAGITVNDDDPAEPVELLVRDCLFFDNEEGHVWSQAGARTVVEHCTFTNRGSTAGPLVRTVPPGRVELRNSIVWGRDSLSVDGGVRAEYCDVRGGATGIGNLDVDPRLAALANPKLLPGSPCIDAGDPLSLPQGLDLEGDPRLVDGDLDGVLAVDMGFDEHDPLHLVVTPTPDAFRVELTGPGGSAWLALGTTLEPELLAGLGFLSVSPAAFLPWPGPPSSAPLVLPPGLPGPVHVQAVLALPPGTPGIGLISNLETLVVDGTLPPGSLRGPVAAGRAAGPAGGPVPASRRDVHRASTPAVPPGDAAGTSLVLRGILARGAGLDPVGDRRP